MARTQTELPAEKDDEAVEKKYTWEDIHRMLFPNGPPEPKTLEELKEGVAEAMRQKYGRR